MARYGLAINVDRCTGCYNCFLSCKDEFAGNDHAPISVAQSDTGPSWVRLQEIEHGTGSKIKVDYIPTLCQHCADAPCVTDDGAVYRRADGIVIIDPIKAKGREEIAESCPYGVIDWNEASQVTQKCTLCAHMIDKGEKTTRCAEACPTQAMVFGDMDDPASPISLLIAEKADKLEDYRPELGTRPVIQYLHLPRPFIAGEVRLAGKESECVRGAKVTLQSTIGGTILTAETDFLGDFEFKGLSTGAMYLLRAEHEGYVPMEVAVRTDVSKNLGELILSPQQ